MTDELHRAREEAWSDTKMAQWRRELSVMVDEMREKAEEVQYVADETHSTLNDGSPASITSEERARQEFASRVQQSGESGFEADRDNFGLIGGAGHQTAPGPGLHMPQNEVLLEYRNHQDTRPVLQDRTNLPSQGEDEVFNTATGNGEIVPTTAASQHPPNSTTVANPVSSQGPPGYQQRGVTFAEQVTGVSSLQGNQRHTGVIGSGPPIGPPGGPSVRPPGRPPVTSHVVSHSTVGNGAPATLPGQHTSAHV